MAERRTARHDDDTEAETPETSIPDTTEDGQSDSGPPTLDTAFFTLCQALGPHLAENLPAYAQSQEIQAWYVNAGAGTDAAGKAQMVLAWKHCILLLEEVLGQKLTPG